MGNLIALPFIQTPQRFQSTPELGSASACSTFPHWSGRSARRLFRWPRNFVQSSFALLLPPRLRRLSSLFVSTNLYCRLSHSAPSTLLQMDLQLPCQSSLSSKVLNIPSSSIRSVSSQGTPKHLGLHPRKRFLCLFQIANLYRLMGVHCDETLQLLHHL